MPELSQLLPHIGGLVNVRLFNHVSWDMASAGVKAAKDLCSRLTQDGFNVSFQAQNSGLSGFCSAYVPMSESHWTREGDAFVFHPSAPYLPTSTGMQSTLLSTPGACNYGFVDWSEILPPPTLADDKHNYASPTVNVYLVSAKNNSIAARIAGEAGQHADFISWNSRFTAATLDGYNCDSPGTFVHIADSDADFDGYAALVRCIVSRSRPSKSSQRATLARAPVSYLAARPRSFASHSIYPLRT